MLGGIDLQFEAQHIHDANLGKGSSKQIWSLIDTCGHQQATIGATLQVDAICKKSLWYEAVTKAPLCLLASWNAWHWIYGWSLWPIQSKVLILIQIMAQIIRQKDFTQLAAEKEEYSPLSICWRRRNFVLTWIESLAGLQYFVLIKCSAQAWKSSKQFCLFNNEPAFLQLMPYSPPPLEHKGWLILMLQLHWLCTNECACPKLMDSHHKCHQCVTQIVGHNLVGHARQVEMISKISVCIVTLWHATKRLGDGRLQATNLKIWRIFNLMLATA